MPTLKARLESVMENVAKAAERSGRHMDDITLIGVSKKIAFEFIEKASALGLKHFGESYIQEAIGKIKGSNDSSITWHAIGPVQSNKLKHIPGLFHTWHTVESVKQLEKIQRQCLAMASQTVLKDMLLQINIGEDANKHGIAPSDVDSIVEEIEAKKLGPITGLMTITPLCDDVESARVYFVAMRQLFEKLAAKKLKHVRMEHLSMGMSRDYVQAVEEGATCVRIGEAIFGPRPK